MHRKPHGFTLIELLVVIAIIAILAAILFPIFITAKATAVTSSCQSNAKQIGIAMQLYSEANDGRLPLYSIGNGASRRLWWEFIGPFLKSGKIYRCPALPNPKISTGQYGANARVYGYGVPYPHLFNPMETKKPPILSTIPRASKTMLMCDSYTMEIDTANRSTTPLECGYPVVYCRCTKGPTGHSFNYAGLRDDGNMGGRHGGSSSAKPWGKTVVLYCDLHVRAWPKEYVAQEYGSREESKNMDLWAHFDGIQ